MKTLTDTIRAIERRLEASQRQKYKSNEDVLLILKDCHISQTEANSVELAVKQQQHRKILPCEIECLQKLGKSLVYTKSCEAGHLLRESDLCAKVAEPNGLSACQLYNVIGKRLRQNVTVDTTVDLKQF